MHDNHLKTSLDWHLDNGPMVQEKQQVKGFVEQQKV